MDTSIRSRSRIRKAAEPTEVNRLHDMLVEEVSLVDAAANKRKFLVVKRNGATLHEVTPDGKGGYTVRKDLVTGDTGTNDTSGDQATASGPATPAPGQPPPKKKPKLDKASLVLTPDAQKQLSAGLKDAIDQLTSFQKEVDGAKTDEEAPPSNDVGAALQSVCEELAELASPHAEQAGADPDMPATEQGAAAAAADAARESAKRLVEKAGAKMAKERYARFKQAVDLLGEIMKELAGDADDAQGTAAATPPQKKPAKPGLAVPAGAQPAAPAAKTDAPAPAAPIPDPATAAAIAALQEQVASLTKHNEGLSTVVKRQSAQLEGLRSPAASNAAVVDSSSRASVAKANAVVWPKDMNARPSRDASLTF